MGGVVTLELEARAGFRKSFKDIFDVLKGVSEHDVLVLKVFELPVVLELLETVEHAEKSKIHRTHVQGCDLRLVGRRRPDPLVHRHGRRAAGGQVDHAVRALLDDLEKRREGFRALIGLAGLGIARVQMHDRGPGFGGIDRGVGDFLRRHGQGLRHRGGVDRAGHGAGDDDFAAHGFAFFVAGGLSGFSVCLVLCAASAARRSFRHCVSPAMRSGSG